MHSYDLEGRTKVVLTIAAASFDLTGLFNEVLSAVDFTPPMVAECAVVRRSLFSVALAI